MLLHASSVSINNQAVLLAGPSGCGKSDLALRLIDAGAVLIADDQTLLVRDSQKLIASAPATIAHMIEVRHVGVLHIPEITTAPVALYIELVPTDQNIERLPDEDLILLDGIKVRRLRLPGFAASTPAKIRAALKYKITQ